MWIFVFLLLLGADDIAADSSAHKWVDILIDQLNKQCQNREIVIFVKDLNGEFPENFLLQRVMNKFLTKTVDFSSIKYNRICLTTSRSTSVYIVLHTLKGLDSNFNSELEEVKVRLNLTVDITSAARRPKCIMILLVRNDFYSAKFVEEILLYAWLLKFLDFTIIVKSKYEATVHLYNPFTRRFSSGHFTNDLVLFPDKAKNMENHDLKMPFIDSLPYVRKIGPDKYDGSDYRIINILKTVLNFKPVLIDYGSGIAALEKAIMDLEAGDINLLPFTLFESHYLTYDNYKVEQGIVYTFDSYTAVVSSSLIQKNIYVSTGILIFSSMGIISIMSLIVLTNCLGITKEFSDPRLVVRMVLRVPAVKTPERAADRIIFFCVFFLSITYFEEIYARLTELKFHISKVSLDTYKEIDESGLIPYASKGSYQWIFNDSDDSLLSIKNKTRIGPAHECIGYLRKRQHVICFMFTTKGEMYIENERQEDGSVNITFSKIQFLINGKNLVFEKASPYVDKIDESVRRIVEAGLLHDVHKKTFKKNPLDVLKEVTGNDWFILLFKKIFIVGYTTSSIIFVLEILTYRLKSYSNKYVTHCIIKEPKVLC